MYDIGMAGANLTRLQGTKRYQSSAVRLVT